MSETSKDGVLLADHAYAFIRRQIVAGVFGPGMRLNEVELTKSIGVSRGPVREAIRRLVASGLASMVPNQGARVVQFDDQAIRSLYEIREATEAMAARLAAQRMTTAERNALDHMLKEHAATFAEQETGSYPSGPHDWDFHEAVLQGSRNEFALKLCAGDLRDLLALVRVQHRRVPGRGLRALAEHRWVADAIIEGNADLAHALMASHIRASYESFKKTNADNTNSDVSRS